MRNALFAAVFFVALFGAHIVSAQEKSQAEAPVPAATSSPPPHLAYLDKSKIIYVADFDAVAAASPGPRSSDAPVDAGSMGSPRANGTDSEPAAAGPRATNVTRMMSDALLHDLKKAGYKVKPLGAREALPEDGMLLTGIFAQVGKDGHLRRADLAAAEKATDVLVYLTTANLSHVAKPMYAVGANDVITLNPDVAVLKFNLGKDSSDKAIKKAADQVVAELERISLQAEAEGLGGSDDPLNKFSKP